MTPTLARRLTAEGVGTALLVAVVVGSGIFAERLSPDDVGLQLLENSLATAGGPVALIRRRARARPPHRRAIWRVVA